METATVATLLLVGALLLFAEVFLPGMIAGSVGMVCIGVGVVLSFVYFGVSVGLAVSMGALVGLGIGTVLWFKYSRKPGLPGSSSRKGPLAAAV